MESSEHSDWKIDIKFKKQLKLEEAKLIFDEAEKAYNDSIETSVRILDRNTSMLQLVAGIIVGLVAYSIGKWEKNNVFDSLLITSISAVVYFLALALFFIFPNIRPTIYVLPGTQPKKLFVDAVFDTPEENRLVLLYMIKITNLQEAIEVNRAINNNRWDFYKKSLSFLFYSPIVIFAIYLLSNLLKR